MLKLRKINKYYQVGQHQLHVLRDIDLDIGEGELVSIMGSSGSGKLTLLNILGILDAYDSGEYWLGTELIRDLSETQSARYRNRFIGFVFQSFNLLPFKTALENVALPLYYQGVSRRRRNKTAMSYLEQVGLAEWAEHRPAELSGGQKQRIAIARALIGQPRLILADEPTGALDSETSSQIMDLLHEINRSGITILVVTHEQDIAARTQRVIRLRDGVIAGPELMFSLDRWHEIWDTLIQNKLRTALTMLAMSWGIFMLVALLGLGRGLQSGVASGFADDALNSIWVFGGQTSVAHEGMPVGRRVVFNNADVAQTRRTRGIEHLSGRFGISGGELKVRVADKVSVFDVRAVHPDHLFIEKTIIVGGRFLNQTDVTSRRKVAVIGIPVAEFLYGETDVVGRWLELNKVSFQVVGVFNDEGEAGEVRKIYIPITTAQAAFNGADKVNQLLFTVGDASVDESKGIADVVKQQLAEHHDFSSADPQAVRVRNNLENYEKFQKIFSMIDIFIWLMGVCTIVAGVVGVSNIMLILVRERTKEIGIRKALGATPWDIVGTILMEAVVLTSAAGYMGLVAGVGFLELIGNAVPKNDMFGRPEVDLGVAVAATVVLITAGALAGFFPARQAAKVNPIVALRDE